MSHDLQITSTASAGDGDEPVAVMVFDDLSVESDAYSVDVTTLRALGFSAKAGESLRLSIDGRPVFAIGLGKREDVTTDHYRRAAGIAVRKASSFAALTIATANEPQAVCEGAAMGAYTFTRHKSAAEKAKLTTVRVTGADADSLAAGAAIGAAVNLARDLVNEPPSSMTPRSMARIASERLNSGGLTVEIWDHDRVVDEQLGGILGVSRGSDEPPRLVKISYEPADASKTVALVGKGITFDSGGLSIKPADAMTEMKTDMAGAAAVLSAMSVLPVVQPGVRVVAFLALAENMPGPKATKPGDVLTARNGKTMEVLNTDAEGRLVLADGLSLAAEEKPDFIIDIATLTGACKIALGNDIAGLFSTHDGLAALIESASVRTGDPVWRLPLPDRYRKLIDSPVADIKNIGSPGGGGAITAALFLKEFAGGTPWAHLDIAGPARGDGDEALYAKGATGYGVRLLVDILRNL